MNRKYRVQVISLVLVAILLSGWLIQHAKVGKDTQGDLHTLDSCFFDQENKFTFDGECVHQTVAQLLGTYSPSDILTFVSATSSSESMSLRCHHIAHAVGEETLKKTNSLELTLEMCPSTCKDGCTHGAIGAEIAREVKIGTGPEYTQDFVHADLHTIELAGKKYCDISNELCHGVGHILYLATQSYLQAAHLCKTVVNGQRIDYCINGVFMEAFQHSLFTQGDTAPTDDEHLPTQPCLNVPQEFQEACYFSFPTLIFVRAQEQPALNMSDVRANVVHACEKLSGEARSYCFQGFGNDAGISEGDFGSVFGEVEQMCTTLPNSADRESCVSGVAEKYARYERYVDGLSYCASIEDQATRAACFNTLFGRLETIRNEGPIPVCIKTPVCADAYKAYKGRR